MLNRYENDFDVLDRLRRHAGFWARVRASLQVSSFITLARMFDGRRDTDTMRDVIRFGRDNHGIFGRDRLAARKRRAGLSATEAIRYAAEAPVVPRSAWDLLQQEVNEKQLVFDAKVAPIRHKVFAHAGRISHEQRDALFLGLMVRTMEDLCVFPLSVHDAVRGFYLDGREPLLRHPPSLLADVIKSLPQSLISTWEHLHVAKDAADFFEWFKSVPLGNEHRE